MLIVVTPAGWYTQRAGFTTEAVRRAAHLVAKLRFPFIHEEYQWMRFILPSQRSTGRTTVGPQPARPATTKAATSPSPLPTHAPSGPWNGGWNVVWATLSRTDGRLLSWVNVKGERWCKWQFTSGRSKDGFFLVSSRASQDPLECLATLAGKLQSYDAGKLQPSVDRWVRRP